MPNFDLLDKVELFVRAGTFPVNATKTSKTVTRAASRHFVYKDGCLWRSYRGRLLRVVRSDEEVREILTRYHDNNNHAGRVRAVKEIMLMYYWVGVTQAVKAWIKACAVCQSRGTPEPSEPPVLFCLAYGCDASSYIYPELSFHRFPKAAERRRRWLAVAQRDEGSLRTNSCLCSRHFEPSCFTVSEEGQLTLSPDAVPTIIPLTAQEDEVPVPSDEDFLQASALEDFLSRAAAAAESSDPAFDHSETPLELQEHQYCLPAPDPDAHAVQTVTEPSRRRTIIEPSFTAYDQIARYLSHRILPNQSKKSRGALRRMAKRFGLIDGVLMYTRVSPPLRVPRSREEVNSILVQFHDNQGHCGQGICQRDIAKHFYWASMTRDLSRWISNCNTCLNRTKRKWLRCSVSNCTNCCGPVERGLGLTFHKFPLHNVALLAQWLKAVGRPNWHPRLRSSVCSTHFTEDCLDRSGGKVTVRPDAVPTLLVHGDSATPSRSPAQPAVGEEAFFAKYDAVELYLSRRTYPPGLSYVEKNTFRRFCKKFTIKDNKLHTVRGDRVRLVLRNRQQVEAALVDYHNELNHLDVKKCLQLLNERYFWKTMRADVVQWIDSCSLCSRKRRKNPEPEPAPQIHEDLDSGKDDDDDYEEDDGGDVDEGGGIIGDEERQPAANNSEEKSSSSQPATPIVPRPRIPIILHLKSPINFQRKASIILHPPRTLNTGSLTSVWPVKKATPAQSEVQEDTNSSDLQPEDQSSLKDLETPRSEEPTEPLDQEDSSDSEGGSARTHQYVKVQGCSTPLTESRLQPELPAEGPQTTGGQPPGQSRGVQRPEKRKTRLDTASPAKKTFSSGLEPVVAPSTKPWPVFTISGSAPTAGPPAELERTLQARTVIQQCSEARVKIKPALDGADAQWAEIQEGMVVYVCFFHGASEDVAYEMANSLMTTKLFRKESGHSVSVLDLPGSVLLIPQDSLLGEPVPRRRIQYKGGCELWWGAQLFSTLVSACRKLVSGSAKRAKAAVRVEQGVYGQKQEMILNSPEPLTLLLEF